jgi:hypothetical protein
MIDPTVILLPDIFTPFFKYKGVMPALKFPPGIVIPPVEIVEAFNILTLFNVPEPNVP